MRCKSGSIYRIEYDSMNYETIYNLLLFILDSVYSTTLLQSQIITLIREIANGKISYKIQKTYGLESSLLDGNLGMMSIRIISFNYYMQQNITTAKRFREIINGKLHHRHQTFP